ncbi:MAG: glycosyltransferase [Nitrospinota bacterium]|nr:MAG: glycosyltransferase [Nitrospinota bacterium]
MQLSIIIPTLNEETSLETTLKTLSHSPAAEVIVVDGGSTDQTLAIARQRGSRVLSAPRGRASQMNAGARAAHGDVLLFLHADTLLPPHFHREIEQALSHPQVIGGRFDVRFDPIDPHTLKEWVQEGLLHLVAFLMNLRSRWTHIATGDQAIFIRRRCFFQLGGYPELPLFEDIELSKRMKRAGEIACLRSKVTTSARRWRKQGVVRTILLMWCLRLLYFLGLSPHLLWKVYRDVR